MSIVTLDGEMVHYEVLGRGRPLFFLHDWVGSWRYWIPTMQAASISFRTYAIDFYGFGDTVKDPEHYSMEEQIKLIGDFMDEMGIMKIALVGHGLGAIVGLQFVLRFPARVDRVLLTGIPIINGAVNTRLRTAPLPELTDWLLSKVPEADPARVEAPKTDPRAIVASFDGLQEINILDLSMQLTTPCLFVHGQNDPAVELPTIDLLGTLPELTHEIVFDASGHFPMLDEPTKYHRLMADFLSLPSGESPRQLQLKEEWKRRIR
jgi:pimeloyl-ACP methyl ester carboxylesterase